MSLTVLLLLNGCANTTGQIRASGLADREAEEYVVYSTIMNEDHIDRVIGRQLVLQTETEAAAIDDSPYLKKELASVSADVVDDYRSSNTESHQLDIRFNINRPYTLISEHEIAAILSETHDKWDAFYDRFPDSAGYYFLSRVGFNSNGDQALVYVGYLCQITCGSGYLYFLTIDNGSWIIQKRILLWQT